MSTIRKASDMEFYLRALASNEPGNNRSRAHNRPRTHERSFTGPTRPKPPLKCSLLARCHRGEVDLYWIVASNGELFWQAFCQGCVPPRWARREPGDAVGRRPRAWLEGSRQDDGGELLAGEV